jgi:hypothetical protein
VTAFLGGRFPLGSTLDFVRLNTGYGGARHVKLHLAGYLQLDDVIPKTRYGAVYPAAGHHSIAGLQIGQHLLRLASLNLLRSDEKKVKDTENENKGKQLSEGSAQEEVSCQKDSFGQRPHAERPLSGLGYHAALHRRFRRLPSNA